MHCKILADIFIVLRRFRTDVCVAFFEPAGSFFENQMLKNSFFGSTPKKNISTFIMHINNVLCTKKGVRRALLLKKKMKKNMVGVRTYADYLLIWRSILKNELLDLK